MARRRARTNLPAFIDKLGGGLVPARHHRLILDKLEAVAQGQIKRLALFLPPGHAKSTYASILFPPWYLLYRPQSAIVAASHTQELADRFGRKVRNMIGSREYQAVSGFGLAPDSQAAGRWETTAGGEYFAVGVGGSVTGRRADLAVIDDPVKSREDADSPTIRDKTWEWYRSDLRTRLKPGGAVVLIQTRWHEDDLAGRIFGVDGGVESGQVTAADGEVWEVINLPALAEAGDALGRSPGEALWPGWLDATVLEQERISQGPRNWSALYQQRPAPETGDFFKREWIKFYDETPKNMAVYGASDYAVTADGGDFTVHGVAGVDPNDDLYILDWWKEQTDPAVWIDTLCALIARYKPREWAEEKGPIAKGLGSFIDKRQREEQAYCARRGYPSSADKATRAQAIRGRMAQGKVYFPRNAPWTADLVAELMSFPAGKHDDQVDVMSLFGVMLNILGKGAIPKAAEPPRWAYGVPVGGVNVGTSFIERRDAAAKARRDEW